MPDPTPTEQTAPGAKEDRLGAAIVLMMVAITVLPLMNVLAKVLSETYPTTQVVWARYAGHTLFVLLLFLPSRGLSLFKASRPGVHFTRSLLMFVCTCLFFAALRYIPVPTASAINFTSPLIVSALAVPFLGEKVGIRRWLAVLVGFAGAMIVIRPGGESAHWAMALVGGTAFFYAVYQILTRRYADADPPETSILWISLVGTVILSFVVPFDWVMPPSLFDWGMLAAVGAMGGLGHFFVIRAFQYGEASVLAPMNYGQIVMATLVSWLVYETFPDALFWVGAAIIAGSGLYIAYRERVRRREASAASQASPAD